MGSPSQAPDFDTDMQTIRDYVASVPPKQNPTCSARF